MRVKRVRQWLAVSALAVPAALLLYLVTFPWIVIAHSSLQKKFPFSVPSLPGWFFQTYGAPWNYFLTDSPVKGPLNDYLYTCRHVTGLE